ncbi:hypothetical protein [Oscillospiraceae bacterium]|nr:hypothetical protein [Oscillospiraceae bacterium]
MNLTAFDEKPTFQKDFLCRAGLLQSAYAIIGVGNRLQPNEEQKM